MPAFNISEEDIDALTRIAYHEAANIAAQTGDLKAAYGSVVDAILNRAAANQRYMGGSNIQNVINRGSNGVYQFTPIAGARGHTWKGLEKPPQAVYEVVKSHLSALQRGEPNTIGINTHYLNPAAAGSNALSSWAAGWPGWQEIGTAPVSHRFGNPDNLTVPDYSVSYEPAAMPTPEGPGEGASPAEQYAYAGLTRSLAPALPVDRAFNTPETVYGRMAATGGLGGILGLDGRGVEPQTFSAPVGPVQRAPLPAVAGTKASPLPAVPVSPVTRSPLAPPPGMATSLPSQQLSAMRPDGRMASYAIPPGYKEAYQQLASTMGTAWVDGIDGRMAPADPIWSGVQPKTPFKQPARPISRTPAAALPFKPGAVKTFPQAPKVPTVPLTTRSIEPVRRESKGQPGGNYAGSGLSATMSVRSGTTPVGTIARSRSDPSVSLVSLPGGKVAHVNDKHGFISTWSPADDDELGTSYGKTLAIDPTGSKYGYYSPGKVPTGWATYSPGKGFSKGIAAVSNARSYGPGIFGGFGKSAGKSAGPSLGGFLSGLFGGRGVAPGKSLGNQAVGQAVGLAAGLFGPAGGMGGLGLGGGFDGPGVGGLGAPGFGGQISSNSNYGGR